MDAQPASLTMPGRQHVAVQLPGCLDSQHAWLIEQMYSLGRMRAASSGCCAGLMSAAIVSFEIAFFEISAHLQNLCQERRTTFVNDNLAT